MKFPDGSLASSASSRFGQFSIQKTVGPNGEKVCSYNKRTFFSWTVHCLRFRFSKAYRRNVMAERLEILSALDESWQGQKFSASDGSYDSNENMWSANVTLSSRRQFNRRVSDLLRLDATSTEPGGTQATAKGWEDPDEPQATAAQQNLLNALGNRHNGTGRVLRCRTGFRRGNYMGHKCTPYVLQFVEDALEARYAANVPAPDGSDKNGELCKYFLTYHTFTSEADEGNLFKWEAVSSKVDSSKVYPMIGPDDLPGEYWHLRVPSDSSIKYAAKIANMVREVGSNRAMVFIAKKVSARDDVEECHIAKQFRYFMFKGLGNDLQAQDYENSQDYETWQDDK